MARREEPKFDGLDIDPRKLSGMVDAGFTAPDVVGYYEGWRAWKVKREPPAFGTAPKLHSASHNNYFWAPRVKAQAECSKCTNPDPTNHKHVPGTKCSCGFYSAKSLKHLRRMGYHSYNEVGSGDIKVVGQLANWGRVIEGAQGWRAEFAYPVVLFVPFEAWRLAQPLQKAYGVPCKLLNLLDPLKFPEEARDLGLEGTEIE